MRNESDIRMANFKAALQQCRNGDPFALTGCQISLEELATISVLAKATGDTFTYGVTQRLLASMKINRS